MPQPRHLVPLSIDNNKTLASSKSYADFSSEKVRKSQETKIKEIYAVNVFNNSKIASHNQSRKTISIDE
jgi:hypothetical protein